MKRKEQEESRFLLRLRLLWLMFREFHFKYKYYLYITLVFLGVLTYLLVPQTVEVEKIPLQVRAMYTCEDFSYQDFKAKGCNHMFSPDLPGILAIYEVLLDETTDKVLYIKWFRGKELLHTSENRFEQDGVSVEPGQYWLASPTAFPLEEGSYRVELHVDNEMLASTEFVVKQLLGNTPTVAVETNLIK